MIVDWLLNEIPQELLQKLEIYTFGCLANHFNNPYQTSITSGVTGSGSNSHAAPTGSRRRRVISHIEHYANVFDFASRWGVLNFTQIKTFSRLENRYMGTVFVNPRSGHQLNQHYLDTIFPLDKTKKYVREPAPGDFMSMEVATYQPGTADREADNPLPSFYVPALYTALGGDASDSMFKVVMSAEMLNVSPTSPMTTSAFDKQDGSRLRETLATRRVQDLSRLWLYRNGGSPPN